VVEDVARRPVRLLADGHYADGSGALDTGGGVDDVPCDEPIARARLESHHRFAGIDSDPHV